MKQLYIIFALAGCSMAQAQVVIQQGAQLKATNNVQITFDNIDVASSDPATDLSQAVVVFKGSNTTSFAGTSTVMIRKVMINKTAPLLLGSNMQVNEQVQFVGGKLDLNNNTLFLHTGATLEGENELNHVVGVNGGLIQTTASLNVPVSQNPGNLGATISSNQNLGLVVVRRWHKPGPGDEQKVNRYYQIVPGNNVALNATLRLNYLDAEVNGLPEPQLAMYESESGTLAWIPLGSSARDGSSNYVEKSGIPTFKQYTLGILNSLPLKWGPVTALCKGNAIEVKWVTLQEQNVKHFVIEKSSDAINFLPIGTVAAAGNSNVPASYLYVDSGATPGTVYYRIKSVDTDGKSSFSGIVNTKTCHSKTTVKLAPVPARSETILTITSDERMKASITLFGMDGRMYSHRDVVLSNGLTRMPFDVSRLAQGQYVLKVEMADRTSHSIVFIKQ